MNIRFRLFLMLALLATSIGARAESVRTDHIEAELIAENTALKPGENWVALRLKPDEGWHTYWKNPGDTGIPTQLNWTLPKGVTAGPIQWPYPQLHKLGGLAYFGYGDETLHLVQITLPANWPMARQVDLQAEAKWLVCADVCIPGKAELSLILPASPSPAADDRWTSLFADARAHLPVAAPWKAQFSVDGSDFTLGLGDAKLLLLTGAWFGWQGVVFALLVGSLLGTLMAIVVYLTRGQLPEPEGVIAERQEVLAELATLEGPERAELEAELARDPLFAAPQTGLARARLAFGPFLSVATLAYALAGPELVNAYLQLGMP